MQRNLIAITACLITLLVAGGCYTREESIVIRADGSATATYKVEGDKADFADGDILPMGAPWVLVKDTEEKGSQGRPDQITRVWELELDDLNDYPLTLSAVATAAASATAVAHATPVARTALAAATASTSVSLETETRLVIEQAEGRTIYRFARRYIGRRVGFLEKLREENVSSELLARVEEDGAEALTTEEQDQLFGELADYEAFAMWARTRNAMGRAVIAGALTADDFGQALEALEDSLQEGLPQSLEGSYLRDFFRLDEAEQEQELQRLRREIVDEAQRHLPPASWRQVESFIEEEERRMGITDDLADELFSLTIEMPGTVVLSNAYLVEEGEVAWEFSGEDLRGGDLVMTAVSVLEHGALGR